MEAKGIPTSVLLQHFQEGIPQIVSQLHSNVFAALELLSAERSSPDAEETVALFLSPLFCEGTLGRVFTRALSGVCDFILTPPTGAKTDLLRGFPLKDASSFRRLYAHTLDAVVYSHEKCQFLAAALSVLQFPETAAAAEILFQRSKTLLQEQVSEFVDSPSESVCGSWFSCPLIWNASKQMRRKLLVTSALGDVVAAVTRCPDEGAYWAQVEVVIHRLLTLADGNNEDSQPSNNFKSADRAKLQRLASLALKEAAKWPHATEGGKGEEEIVDNICKKASDKRPLAKSHSPLIADLCNLPYLKCPCRRVRRNAILDTDVNTNSTTLQPTAAIAVGKSPLGGRGLFYEGRTLNAEVLDTLEPASDDNNTEHNLILSENTMAAITIHKLMRRYCGGCLLPLGWSPCTADSKALVTSRDDDIRKDYEGIGVASISLRVPCPYCAKVLFCCEDCRLASPHVQLCKRSSGPDAIHPLSIGAVLAEPRRQLGALALAVDDSVRSGGKGVLNDIPANKFISESDLQLLDMSSGCTALLQKEMSPEEAVVSITDSLVNALWMSCAVYGHKLGPTQECLTKAFVVYQKISSNCFDIMRFGDTDGGKRQLVGHGVYRTLSSVNHSCRPNCFVSSISCFTMSLRAIRPIAKGEELTIAYGAREGVGTVTANANLDRRTDLQRQFGFVCKCKTCECVLPVTSPLGDAVDSWNLMLPLLLDGNSVNRSVLDLGGCPRCLVEKKSRMPSASDALSEWLKEHLADYSDKPLRSLITSLCDARVGGRLLAIQDSKRLTEKVVKVFLPPSLRFDNLTQCLASVQRDVENVLTVSDSNGAAQDAKAKLLCEWLFAMRHSLVVTNTLSPDGTPLQTCYCLRCSLKSENNDPLLQSSAEPDVQTDMQWFNAERQRVHDEIVHLSQPDPAIRDTMVDWRCALLKAVLVCGLYSSEVETILAAAASVASAAGLVTLSRKLLYATIAVHCTRDPYGVNSFEAAMHLSGVFHDCHQDGVIDEAKQAALLARCTFMKFSGPKHETTKFFTNVLQ